MPNPDDLLKDLAGLLPAQFDTVLERARAPREYLSAPSAPLATRAIELLSLARNDERLLSAVLDAIRWVRQRPVGPGNVPDNVDRQNEIITLRWLCERPPLHVLLECYRGVTGPGALLDGLTDASRIIDKLADATISAKNRLPLLEFAIWLECLVEKLEDVADWKDICIRAADWSNAAARRRTLTAADLADLRATISAQVASRRMPDRIVIRLDESYGSPTRYVLSVVLLRGSGAVDPLVADDDDRAYSLGEIRALLARSIGGWALTCNPTGLVIEFLVPLGLLGEPFDQWPVKERDSDDTTPLGVLCWVLVRDLQRAEEEPNDLWRWRWKLLQASRRPGEAEAIRWIPSAVAQMVALRAEVQDGEWACLAFERFSGDEMSRRFIAAGIDLGAPAILWVRPTAGEVGQLAELRRELSATPLPRLPAKLFDLRRDAVRYGRPADHCGRSIALLWHDPDCQRPAAKSLMLPTLESD